MRPETMTDKTRTSTPSSLTLPVSVAIGVSTPVDVLAGCEIGIDVPAIVVTQSCDELEAEATNANMNCSPFHIMKLPKELRLMIHESLFQDILNDISNLRYPGDGPSDEAAHETTMQHHLKRSLALAHTSRKLRAESLQLCSKLAETLAVSLWNDSVPTSNRYAYTDDFYDDAAQAVLAGIGTRLVGAKRVDSLLWWMHVDSNEPLKKPGEHPSKPKRVHTPYMYARGYWTSLYYP